MNVLIVDLSALFWMTWHALRGDGQQAHDNTVARIRSMATKYDRTAIALDVGRCFRKGLFPDYKAQRPDKEPAAIEQLRRVQETLREDFTVWGVDTFEADDVIATFCLWANLDAAAGGIESVTIACSDKDLLQCVGGKVSAMSLAKSEVRDAKWVYENFGCTPDKVPTWLALVGDAADNLPGVDGCGAKTATKWVREFGGHEGIELAVEAGNIKGKLAENFTKANESGAFSQVRQLATLRTDVPFDCAEILAPREPKPMPEEIEAEIEPEPATEDAKQDDADVEQPSRQLVRVSGEFSKQLEPPTMKAAHWLSGELIRSGALGGINSAEQTLAIIIAGREFGFGAMASLRGFYVVKGRVSMSAQTMAGLVLSSGLAEYFEPILDECTAKSATWVTKRKSSPREQRFTFTTDDAKLAGLLGNDNWKKRPGTMCSWRACTSLARAIYPDAVGNMYSPEELEEQDR